MAFAGRLLLLALIYASYYCFGNCSKVSCESPQYLNYGESDTVNCIFHEEFFSVLWFDGMDYTQSNPILHYQESSKSGAGYISGEYDIFSNGSLVITNVSLKHDTIFTVAYVHTRKSEIFLLRILAIVVVKPQEPFPLINYCGRRRVCFSEFGVSPVECSVNNVKPNVTLNWITRTVDGYRNITGDMSVISAGIGYTTRVATGDVFRYSPTLELLVCEASCPKGMLESKESVILVQYGGINLSTEQKQVRYIERYTRMNLDCTDGRIGFVVWKKTVFGEKQNQTDHHILLYSIFIGERYTAVFENGVSLGKNASLVVPVVDVGHDGLYYCIHGDGLKDGIKVYEVIVKVPTLPVIEGCSHQQYCVLDAYYEGSLTCKLKGIRPLVQLKWNTFPESDAASISFTKQHVIVKENQETFDVTLTSTYRVLDRSRDRLTIQCNVEDVAQGEGIFHLTTKVDLLFVKDILDPTKYTDLTPMPNVLTWIIPSILILLLLLILLFGAIFFKKQVCKGGKSPSRMKQKRTEEALIMLSPKDFGPPCSKEQLLRQVKERYKDLYDAVQPIPYIKDRLYCVDKIFVEGGIEFLDSATLGGRLGEWKRLGTYQDIFDDPRVKSRRRILEGEPGYGKSTVTLQYAYDWCNASQGSALKDVELLILLRLRQLGNIPSIYRAIKQFILPKDTTLTESDIKKVLGNCASVVIILDGFDEYPDQDSEPSTDVINIIARQMFQEYEVVTTTRSSFLPKKCPPLTKRVRLTGFNADSRSFYLRKAVVGDDEERVREIEQYLEENAVLNDLCQVPLLFVIFAHMTYESEKFRSLNSVTGFFRYMISCFHSHMRNKMEDDNARKYKLFEEEHRKLDRVAFEALSGNTKKIVWKKERLSEQIGQEFYDQYVRIGILVEEEVIDIIDDPGTLITEHVQYKTEVRFYHKLFCEWYAAHYLAHNLQKNPNVDLSAFLQHLHPFDVQYMYRFSCGLNSDSAEKIISYLKDIEGGDKFAILCILEQTGKVDLIKEPICQMCKEGVVISGHDSLLLQRSTVQLLELAARRDIPIDGGVCIYNCLQSVDLSAAAIRTTSGLLLVSKIPFKKLMVSLTNRKVTEDEVLAVTRFSTMCPSLSLLWFYGWVPFRSLNSESILSTLKSRNITVWWHWSTEEPRYNLNLDSGRWQNEDDGSEPTVKDFERMLQTDAKIRNEWTEEIFKGWVKTGREKVREYDENRRVDR